METKNTNHTETKSRWDEYWANRIDEYYRTSGYKGD